MQTNPPKEIVCKMDFKTYTKRLFLSCSMIGASALQAGYEYKTVHDSTARDAFLAKIDNQIGVLKLAISRLDESTKARDNENQEARLALADIYTKREELLQSNEEILKDYLTLKSQIHATKVSVAGLSSMQALMSRVLEQPLSEDITRFLEEYIDSTTEQKILLRRQLNELRKRTLDPEEVKTVSALEKSLEYYGIYLNEVDTKNKNREEMDIVVSVFTRLRTYFNSGDRVIKEEIKNCDLILEKQKQELARFEVEMVELKKSGGKDFEQIDLYNAEIATKNNLIAGNKSYSGVILVERSKLEQEITDLEEEKKKAPPVGLTRIKVYKDNSMDRALRK